MLEKTISHYHIKEKIGGGGMGVVYKADDTKLHRSVALKFLPASFSFDEEAKKRFIYEAQAASSIQHNNICNIHDIDETEDGQLFICMDFYNGETLKHKIQKGPLKINTAVDISIQTAQGLLKVHEQKIIHRDIKPANIFVTDDGIVKILDFGLAKLSGQVNITKMGSTIGTVAYMSPEQALGEKIDNRTDIWSLGVVLYEMLTGRTPFQSDFDQAVLYSILNEEPEPVSSLRTDVPLELERIILKALNKSPEDRYQHIDEMIVDLRNIKRTEQISAARPVKLSRNFKFSGFVFKTILVLLLLFSVTAVWTFIQRSNSMKEKRKFIAVLPFKPITNSAEDKYFAEGIHDDIMIQLSKIGELKVIAKSSVMEYQNSNKPLNSIADELGVGVILDGSTRRNEDMIRVNARLVDPSSGENLWAETYDRPYEDIFEIQSDLAQKIAAALQIKLAKEEIISIETEPTENMLAWDYFRKGKYFWEVSYNYEGNLNAAEMFEKASEIDTLFSLAWAYQSMAYSVITAQSPEFDQRSKFIKKAEYALEKASQTKTELPELHLARAHYQYHITNNLDEALRETEIANKIKPNDANTLYFLSIILSNKGNWKRGYELAELTYQLDPKGTGGPLLGSWSAFGLGKYKDAEKWADVMIQIDPESGSGYSNKIRAVLDGLGEIDRANSILKEAKRFVKRDTYHLTSFEFWIHIYKRNYYAALKAIDNWEYPIRFYLRAIAYSLLYNHKYAVANFDSARIEYTTLLKDHPENQNARLRLGIAYAGLGDKINAFNEVSKTSKDFRRNLESEHIYLYILLGRFDEALQILDSYLDERTELTHYMLKLDPRFDPIRHTTLFNKLLERTKTINKSTIIDTEIFK